MKRSTRSGALAALCSLAAVPALAFDGWHLERSTTLDSKTAAEVLDLFDRLHRERSLTFIVVTHSEDLAERAQRTVRLQDGRVISDTLVR